jgi:group I intron endonuclease
MKSIYKIENKINGKLYIGQTINSLKTRFKKHLSQINCKNQCSALYSAIRKYGKENFEISEIVSGDFSKDELNNLEIFFIQHYNTLSPNGYNLQTGGNTTTLADEVKKSISNTMMGRKITWSEKISETIKQKWQNPEYREKQTNQIKILLTLNRVLYKVKNREQRYRHYEFLATALNRCPFATRTNGRAEKC